LFFNEKEIVEIGKCHVVFVCWKEKDEIEYDILESNAWKDTDFQYNTKDFFEKYGGCCSDDYLNENFNCSGIAEELTLEVLKENSLATNEKRYFEFVADYICTDTKDYFGEVSTDEEIKNLKWQEISKEEWEMKNGII